MIGCSECNSPYNCTQCADDFFLFGGKCYINCQIRGKIINFDESTCIDKCPTYYYPFFDSYLNQTYCKNCDENCEKCPYSDSCSRCQPGWFLYQNKCLDSCPKNYFYIDLERRCSNCPKGQYELFMDDKFSTCEACSPKCILCSISKEYCTSCNKGFYSFNGTCESKCPVGTVADTTSGSCLVCHESCFECFGISNQSCIKCAENLLFLEHLD